MIDKILKIMSYKTYSGNWNIDEITFDLIVVIIVGGAIWLMIEKI